MQSLALFLLVLTSGFTTSAIAANLYRISGLVPETTYGHIIRVCVLTLAGPSEMFETAITARINRESSPMWFWLMVSATCYWSCILGLAVTLAVKRLSA
jgi:hypothetical protein